MHVRRYVFVGGSCVILAALLMAAVVTRSKPPNMAACRQAIEQEWNMVLTGYTGPAPSSPKECKGLKGQVVEQIWVDTMKEHS